MNRRLAHQTRHTIGADRRDVFETPCLGSEGIYDVLFDRRGGPEWNYAIDQARTICGSCPIMVACFRENRDEEWVRAVVTKRSRHTIPAEPAPPKEPTPAGEILRQRHAATNAERLVDVLHLIDQGADAEAVSRALGITRASLYKWCRRNAPDAWTNLAANERKAVA